MRKFAAILGASVLAAGSLAPAAWACGGFFCRTLPIDQAGEKIVFGVDQDKEEVVAIIQIQYQGKAEDFSWIIPLPKVPDVAVSSDEIFTRLGPPTMPRYSVKYKKEGTCKTHDFLEGSADDAVRTAAPLAGSPGSVEVLKQEKVGPFEATVLRADDPEALQTWLKDNGYNIPETFGKLAGPYIEKKNVFCALKLQKDKDAGDLQPIVLKLKESYPCVPIRLTAIAATEDMPIILWIFGKARAIPRNYYHLHLNDALIDWVGADPYPGGGNGSEVGILPIGAPFFGTGAVRPAPNYDAVVTEAMHEASEAGNNGFVTELATASSAVKTALTHNYDSAKLAAITDATKFMQEIRNQNFPRTGAMQNIFRKYLPLPNRLKTTYDEMRWWNDLFFGGGLSKPTAADFADFKPAEFAAELHETFVKPIDEGQALIGRLPYLTRLYTTMTREAMQKEDPLFAFNGTLPDVSNLHAADGTLLCNADVYEYEAPIRLTLADGTQFTISRTQGRYPPLPITAMPAAYRIEMLEEEGGSKLQLDNKPVIDEAIRKLPPEFQGVPGTGGGGGGSGGSGGSGDSGAAPGAPARDSAGANPLAPGCACRGLPTGASQASDTSGADHEALLWGVTLGTLVVWRRRKKV